MSDAQARGGGGPGVASITISPTNAFANLSDKSPGSSLYRGLVLIHELFHVAGYDHQAMAEAMNNMREKFVGWKAWKGAFPNPQDQLFSGPNGRDILDSAYSGFFGNVLAQHCK